MTKTKKSQITTEQFLEGLYRDTDSIIYFNVDRKTWKNKPQTYSEAKSKLEYLNNNLNSDIYFIPNSGGSKDSQISQINSAFIDWDAGRDSDSKYHNLETVKQKKIEFLNKLDQFPYKPSYTIETRNGYHVYWLFHSSPTVKQFVFIQKQLIKYFDSDPQVCNPARVMRLPGYYACKSGQYDPFLVSIIDYNQVYYTVDIFISYFSSHSGEDCSQVEPVEVRKSAHNNTYINKEYTRSIIMGTKPQTSTEQLMFDNMDEVTDYICKQNMAEYMELDNYRDLTPDNSLIVNCPFHSDETPSASIYYHKENCYLKCHSKNCEFESGSIIKILEMRDDITEGEAVRKLMEYYNISLDDSWQNEEEIKYKNNIELINEYMDWEEKYPNLCRCIKRIYTDLLTKQEIAKGHIKLRTSKGKDIFFCSLTEFERRSKNKSYLTDRGRQNERVDRYCLLGLMEKVNSSEIPYGLYRNMQEVKGKKQYKYRVQCYHIPEYTPELLQKADNIARIAKERGMKLNSITKNSIRDIFGEEMAKNVYPQVEDITPSDSGCQLLENIEIVIDEEIRTKGYTTTSVIKNRLKKATTWKSVHDRRVKEHMPGLLEKHNLIEITANKKIKNELCIESKGYPKIVILKKDYEVLINKPKETTSSPVILDETIAA
jgi:hypothetical protein